jgi:hypothetical protein
MERECTKLVNHILSLITLVVPTNAIITLAHSSPASFCLPRDVGPQYWSLEAHSTRTCCSFAGSNGVAVVVHRYGCCTDANAASCCNNQISPVNTPSCVPPREGWAGARPTFTSGSGMAVVPSWVAAPNSDVAVPSTAVLASVFDDGSGVMAASSGATASSRSFFLRASRRDASFPFHGCLASSANFLASAVQSSHLRQCAGLWVLKSSGRWCGLLFRIILLPGFR